MSAREEPTERASVSPPAGPPEPPARRPAGAATGVSDRTATERAEPAAGPPGPERTDVVPRPKTPVLDGGNGAPSPTRRRARRNKPVPRRVKRTLRRLDLVSVLKISLFYSVTLFLLWLGFVAVVFSVLEAFGVFTEIERFLSHPAFYGYPIEVTLGAVERWAALVGAVFVLLGTIASLFLAWLYNVGSSLLGGLELTFIERDS